MQFFFQQASRSLSAWCSYYYVRSLSAWCSYYNYVSLACTVVEAATWSGDFIQFGVVALGVCTGCTFWFCTFGLVISCILLPYKLRIEINENAVLSNQYPNCRFKKPAIPLWVLWNYHRSLIHIEIKTWNLSKDVISSRNIHITWCAWSNYPLKVWACHGDH